MESKSPLKRLCAGALFALLAIYVPEASTREADQPTTTPSFSVLFENGRFDGEKLVGRIMIGAKRQSVWISQQALDAGDVRLERVVRCGSSEALSYWIHDFFGGKPFGRKPKEEHSVEVTAGYWYGMDVDVVLHEVPPRGYPCVIARWRIEVRDETGKPHETALIVRAARGGRVVKIEE